MKSQALYDSNIRYLQHESTKFTTYSGREWIVYGSPVRRINLLRYSSMYSDSFQSAPQYARGSFQYSTAEEAQGLYITIPWRVFDLSLSKFNSGLPTNTA